MSATATPPDIDPSTHTLTIRLRDVVRELIVGPGLWYGGDPGGVWVRVTGQHAKGERWRLYPYAAIDYIEGYKS